jgi:Adenylate and Guanylate cyclase catalytic domain
VNTAARMEAYGKPRRIQASAATAELLIAAGKEDWVIRNEEAIDVKGKGMMVTYFIYPSRASRDDSIHSGAGNADELNPSMIAEHEKRMAESPEFAQHFTDYQKRDKFKRLVAWNVEVLCGLLQTIASQRPAGVTGDRTAIEALEQKILQRRTLGTVLDEAVETLIMPLYPSNRDKVAARTAVSTAAKEQLHDFVTKVGMSYCDVPFHNLDHASHVLMSVTKSMGRIVEPECIDYTRAPEDIRKGIHESTYGISSYPLLQFAAAFSALIRKE